MGVMSTSTCLIAQPSHALCEVLPAKELPSPAGHELCRSAAEQHVSELSNWPPAQKALLLRWALHSSSAATVPDSLRQAVISATQPSNSPSPSPAFGEAVMATAAEDGVKPHTLAGMVEEMGYACTASQRTFEEALQQAGPVDERGVAELLAMMARTHASLSDPHGSSSSVAAALSALGAGLGSSQGNGIWSSDQTWNMDLAVDVLRSKHPHLDWQQLPQQLDHPGFDLPDPKAFQVGCRCDPHWRPASGGYCPPAHCWVLPKARPSGLARPLRLGSPHWLLLHFGVHASKSPAVGLNVPDPGVQAACKCAQLLMSFCPPAGADGWPPPQHGAGLPCAARCGLHLAEPGWAGASGA